MAHMFLYTFVLVHQTISVQVCHVTLDRFSPFTRIFMMVAMSILLIFQISYFKGGEIDTKLAMTILLGMTFVCQWHFILNIVYEMSSILDIAVFRVW